jgi:hypothetical protein
MCISIYINMINVQDRYARDPGLPTRKRSDYVLGSFLETFWSYLPEVPANGHERIPLRKGKKPGKSGSKPKMVTS